MGKGDLRRPGDDKAFAENYERVFGRKTSGVPIVTESDTPPGPRHLAITLDEVRTIVFRTSVAYAGPAGRGAIQEAEWARAAALRDALTDLGFVREAEMIGGAG